MGIYKEESRVWKRINLLREEINQGSDPSYTPPDANGGALAEVKYMEIT
jgi:hypothetical protein